tara:strand:- start:249 stop:548 length:300 start_codon:yes stop_codon:yes gene_type:complete
MKKIYLLFLLLLFGCGGLSDAGKVIRNEKVKTTDEFLVKKRDPLVLPPNYKDLPKPGTNSVKNNEDDKIKQILKVPKEDAKSSSKSSSIEDSIIDKILK